MSQPLPASVNIYTVGGAVRDALLGLPSSDRDFVVTGATPEMMVRAGYKPVGKDFPVFLHPETHEEYALARTEKKDGRGYHGFMFYTSPDVTITDDLRRRDVTINAMAIDKHGVLIDPFSGKRDLALGVLRHVSPAFAEDPLRVLRVARFAARFDFKVAEETLALMRAIVQSDELETLPAERLWQETAKALMSQKPARYLQVLRECGALSRLMPEVDALYGVPQKPEYHPEIDTGLHVEAVLNAAARFASATAENPDPLFDLPVRYALLCHDLGKAATPAALLPSHHGHEERGVPLARQLSARLSVPQVCADTALLVTKWHGALKPEIFSWSPKALLRLLLSVDALRRPERLKRLIACNVADKNAHAKSPAPNEVGDYLISIFSALRQMNLGEIAKDPKNAANPAKIADAIRKAQLHVIAAVIKSSG
ncbi:MAG: multifunctional CCA addition/repair protein [Burkholderiales bacterium]|jgi:tRNA nucleotidyltransferase (CCA-adding enzyme)|nr:multifunctional CCA addition/repair protein [Burkholderiales bacterium]